MRTRPYRGIIMLASILVASTLTGVNTHARSFQEYDGIRIAERGGPDSPGNRGQRGGPPPEAVEACAGAAVSGTCAFTSPLGDKINGTCEYVPGDIFACVPDGGPPGGSRSPGDAPPPE
jgi:hypothetical protein